MEPAECGAGLGCGVLLLGCQSDVVYVNRPASTLITPLGSLTDTPTTTTINTKSYDTNSPTSPAPIVPTLAVNNAEKNRIQQRFNARLACPVTVLQPAVLQTQPKRVLLKQGVPQYVNIPAVMRTVASVIQTQPARFTNETVPAVYKTVTEKVPIRRERKELYAIPASYRAIDKTIEVTPAHLVWKAGCFGNTASDATSASQACMVMQPAQTQTIKQQLVDVPPQFKWRTIPAEYVDVERKVLVKAGVGSGPVIPAEYRTLQVYHVATRWSIQSKPQSDEYQTISTQVLTRPARPVSQLSLCEGQLNERDVTTLQTQLNQVSGQTLNVSGKLDDTTRQALLRYQQRENLAQGAITLETLRALGF